MSNLMISTFVQNLRLTISAKKQRNRKNLISAQKKNATSKNDPKSRLGALDQKLWLFYDFFTDMKFDHWQSI